MQAIPTLRDTPFYTQKVTLDGKEYTFRFEWNQRNGWFLGLEDADGVIFDPRKIVIGWDLLRPVRWNTRAPQGALLALDRTGELDRIGYSDMSTSFDANDGPVLLAYITEAERAAFGG